MSQIVEKMRQEIIDRSARFEELTKGTKDEYNIYREHIQYVYKYVVMLSKDKNVDREVLESSIKTIAFSSVATAFRTAISLCSDRDEI